MGKQFEATEEDIGAQDYRAYFDSSVFRVWHLDGKERTFKIVRCTRLSSEFKGERRKQPLLHLEDSKGRAVPLPLALNKTNAKTIAQLYGSNPMKWAGQLVTLYPTTTDVAGRTEDCIRVRPEDPRKRARSNKRALNGAAPPPAAEPEREPGADSTDEEPPMGALETDHLGDDHADAH